MIDTTSEQRMWDEEGRPLKVRTLSCVNAEYNYSWQSTLNTMIEQKCDDQIRMRGRRFCSCLKDVTGVANEKRCCVLANDYQLFFLNQTQCYKTQSKLPSMINTTSEQRMWDEEGRPLKVRILSRVNAEYDYSRQSTLNTMIEQKCDDQIRMRGRRFC
jgi:hypothetical protein